MPASAAAGAAARAGGEATAAAAEPTEAGESKRISTATARGVTSEGTAAAAADVASEHAAAAAEAAPVTAASAALVAPAGDQHVSGLAPASTLPPSPSRVGLLNMGNTCWLNAVLQVRKSAPVTAGSTRCCGCVSLRR